MRSGRWGQITWDHAEYYRILEELVLFPTFEQSSNKTDLYKFFLRIILSCDENRRLSRGWQGRGYRNSRSKSWEWLRPVSVEALRSSWIHTLILHMTDFFFFPEGLDAKYGNACMLSCFSYVRLFATLWTIVRQAPLSMGFSTQEYWSGLPCAPPGDLPNPETEPMSLKYGNTYLLSMGMLLLSCFSHVWLYATP